MTTWKVLFLLYEIQNTPNTYLRKMSKFQGDGICRFAVLGPEVVLLGKHPPSVYRVKLLYSSSDVKKMKNHFCLNENDSFRSKP